MHDIPHGDVMHEDLVHQTTAAHIAFETQTDIRADEIAIADKDIMHSPVRIAADDKSAMRTQYRAPGDDHILQQGPGSAVMPAAAGFHTDAVISGADRAMVNNHI